MNQYIKYLSTRPKQTHIKCFEGDNLQDREEKENTYIQLKV